MIEEINKVIGILETGGVILYPTDTIWGIGCDATNSDAVRKIYDIKKRPDSKSCIVLMSDLNHVKSYFKQLPNNLSDVNSEYDSPTSIILSGAKDLPENLVASDGTLAMRIPKNNSFCIELLKKFKKPIVSTSANISGFDAPKMFVDIVDEIKEQVDYIVDPSFDDEPVNQPSRIVKVNESGGIQIIRE